MWRRLLFSGIFFDPWLGAFALAAAIDHRPKRIGKGSERHADFAIANLISGVGQDLVGWRVLITGLYPMYYLVAVLGDRIQAEAAYCDLEKAGLPMDKVAILGRGYKSADEFGLLDPKDQANKLIRLMSFWLIPFGFAAGYTFNYITRFDIFPWAGEIGSHLIGGLLGAASGAMGSFFVGGGVGIAESGDALSYRNRLDAGKFLVVVKGSESLTKRATPILRQYDPENLQGYEDTTVAY